MCARERERDRAKLYLLCSVHGREREIVSQLILGIVQF